MRTVLSRLTSTVTRGAAPGVWPLLAAVWLALALGAQAAARGDASDDVVRLESIAGQFDQQSGSILIQTSAPVAYVTADPDPLTVLVDLHNVTSAGVSNRFATGGGDLVSAVTVEDTTASDGARIARVRVSLARPLAHRVRSARNVIRVEVDRQAAAIAAVGAAVGAPGTREATQKPATVLRSLRALPGAGGPTVVLEGNGALTPINVELTKEVPYRLVLDFEGVSSSVKPMTQVGNDPVDRVRVGRHSAKPLITRVVIDLKNRAAYRVDQSEMGLAVVFGVAAPPTAAAAKPAPPAEPAPAVKTTGEVATRPSQDTGDLVRRLSALQDEKPATAAAQPRVQEPPVATPPARPPVTAASRPPAQDPPAAAPPPAQPPAAVAALRVAAAAQQPPAGAIQPPAQQLAARAQPADMPADGVPGVPSPATATAQEPQGQAAEKKYTGAPISLDFAGANIRDVMRVFADASGLNIIIDPKVQGTVDVALRDVPWDQAMEIILKSAGLGWSLDGNVVRIAPVDVLISEEKKLQEYAAAQAASTATPMTRTLSYAAAKDLKGVIQNSGVLTKNGQIQVDDRTNTLIIRDVPSALPAITRIIDTLDKAQPQVEIEARIVQTTRNFARQLGIKWGFMGRVDQAIGNATGLAFPNTGSIGGRTGGTMQGGGSTPVVNLGTTGLATSAVGLSLGSVNGAFNLDIELSALESQGKGRILSAPRVLAQNNFQAEMTQGVQIPIQTLANNTISVTFKDAALKLLVTPQVTANQTVIMNITLENATPDYTKQINQIPPINTQRAVTQVMTSDNQTVVIGGVFVSREQSQNDHTPALWRIPLLGWLFRRDTIDDESNELLIFLTPRIVKI